MSLNILAKDINQKHEFTMKRKILVVDDDDLVRKSIEGVLRLEGYESVCAKDPSEALNQIREIDFDLVISDIRMPGMNGVEAARKIRKMIDENAKKQMPIIFITGYAETSVELDAEKLGEVILKPFDMTRLAMAIREYL